MVCKAKALGTKPDSLSMITGAHMTEEETNFKLFSDLKMIAKGHAHKNTH